MNAKYQSSGCGVGGVERLIRRQNKEYLKLNILGILATYILKINHSFLPICPSFYLYL
jgi:hypothetical protein